MTPSLVLNTLLPRFITDLCVELRGNHQITRGINEAIANGDEDAIAVFRTGTLAAALTTRGLFRRSDEIVAYAQRVKERDGSMHRYYAVFRYCTDPK
ncbi:hypothetical protein [Streptomyces sp. BPTC-684]|uniref:hypothetical protein n=1 Tax=Streptomyces sp. BPTC-684 TaxID=3043734 RepID=UPI0024B1930E|nr:hypothetical protein [Streptomyces sp. BPTC-684]WHM41096.1 hypothetical protein QIY60_32400 [Streptomyces sp. BPTC-684]